MEKKYVVILAACVTCAVLIAICVLFAVNPSHLVTIEESSTEGSFFPSCDRPRGQEYSSSSKAFVYPSAAVSTDAEPCAKVALDILNRNGTAVDASIGAMFCVGIFNAQSSGLGGGFVATIYSKKEGVAYSLDAREVAPAAAHPKMFEEAKKVTGEQKWYESEALRKVKGGLAVAVPGEVDGLYELYERFGGGVPWRELLEPARRMCIEGYELSWYTGKLTYVMRNYVLTEPSMRIFASNASAERVLREGEKVYRKQLASTLRALQEDPKALKRGPLAMALIKDLNAFGGIITERDLENYRPVWREPVSFHLKNGNFTIRSFPPPGSGFVLGFALKILDQFGFTDASLRTPEKLIETHRIFLEAFKFSYAQRSKMGDLTQAEIDQISVDLKNETLIKDIKAKIDDLLTTKTTSQDPSFYGTETVPDSDSGGTTHFSLVASNGDAVAITSSINMGYGAGIRSESTGVIFNNHMADFTSWGDSNRKTGTMKMTKNSIIPGHRPLSSMSPTVILDNEGNVKLVLGAAGGIQIPSGCTWVTARFLWMNQGHQEAIDACRTHHSLIPMKLRPENGLSQKIIRSLEEVGHSVKSITSKSVVSSIGRLPNGSLVTSFDFRKSGGVSGF